MKKRQEEAEEDELLKSTSSESSDLSESGGDSNSAEHSTSAKSDDSSGDSSNQFSVPATPPNAESLGRRASIVASSNINPSDGDDEGSENAEKLSGKSSEKMAEDVEQDTPGHERKPVPDPENTSLKSTKSKASSVSGSMDSNRSELSSKSDVLLIDGGDLPNGHAGAAASQDDPENLLLLEGDFGDYDAIENQLVRDQEKELEYLNGLDEPINKADLPLIVPDENENGPYMNEPMKLRYAIQTRKHFAFLKNKFEKSDYYLCLGFRG